MAATRKEVFDGGERASVERRAREFGGVDV